VDTVEALTINWRGNGSEKAQTAHKIKKIYRESFPKRLVEIAVGNIGAWGNIGGATSGPGTTLLSILVFYAKGERDVSLKNRYRKL